MMKPKDFVVGNNYYTNDLVGAASDISYKCVHVGKELVVFVYEYQGRERVHSQYLHELRPETFTRRRVHITQAAANDN